jgi:hypothetical protein
MNQRSNLAALKTQLAHTAPHMGTGVRRALSEHGAWLDDALERGRRLVELRRHYYPDRLFYAEAEALLGIRQRQVRSLIRLWQVRDSLQLLWDELPPTERPRTIEAALALHRLAINDHRASAEAK